MVYNIKLIDFAEIYQKSIQKTLLDILYINNYLKNDILDLRNQDIKKIIENVLFNVLRPLFNNVENNKTILIVQPDTIPVTEIHHYCDFNKFQKLLLKLLKLLQQEYPKKIFIFKKSVDLASVDVQALIYHKANTF
jgi:hypothetical protein